ncbi:hypothetical protein [Thermococcus sp. GR4]|uniref:hypothetical protein n=1 Tax=Thermococcus sp. GR4 TaxID=1638254 RepID=UPI001431DEBF|nr:hypothetical protein [Thermococcus sp. GR4]NJE79425.1 hypothetical protein [Thermococcus sp. GR4]
MADKKKCDDYPTFMCMFREFGGIRRILKEIDFRLAVILAFIITATTYYFRITSIIIEKGAPLFITVSGTMIAIAIAGLAIISSLSDPEFLKALKQAEIFNRIMFMFYYSTVISGLSILSNLFAYLILQIFSNKSTDVAFSANYYLIAPQKVVGNATITTIVPSNDQQILFAALLFLSLGLMLYSVFAVILLVGTTMRYGIYREMYYELKDKK